MGYGWYLPEISDYFLPWESFPVLQQKKMQKYCQAFYCWSERYSFCRTSGWFGRSIIIVLQEGHIIDPILHSLASLMSEAGRVLSLGIMYLIQTMINIIIPSGSAKAALTMPIMAPFSDVIGLSRQATVMAFQFGDGFTNMITPTSGVLIGALGIARIPYDIWVKFFWKFILLLALSVSYY